MQIVICQRTSCVLSTAMTEKMNVKSDGRKWISSSVDMQEVAFLEGCEVKIKTATNYEKERKRIYEDS